MKKTIIAVGGGSYGQIKTYPDGRQVQKNKDSVEIDKKMIKISEEDYLKIISYLDKKKINSQSSNSIITK